MQIPKKQLTRQVYIPAAPQWPAVANPIQSKTSGITIWVHGTRFFPEIVFSNFFYCKRGLHHYTEIAEKYHHRKIAQTLIDNGPDRFCLEHFYLFGWSGTLSFKERELAARQLYLELKELRQDYKKKYGSEPIIRILAHSHGGNVVLLLERVKDKDDTAFAIDELILLAVPVQTHTMYYTHAPVFKKVYSLYSMFDALQVADPQGLQICQAGSPLFSERQFPPHEKVHQCAIKIDNRSLRHIDFVRRSFLCKLPAILDEVDQWQNSCKLHTHICEKQNKCLCIKTK